MCLNINNENTQIQQNVFVIYCTYNKYTNIYVICELGNN
jgi:hypothetical protein